MLILFYMQKALEVGLTGLFLLIDGVVYWAISKLFGLYASLAGAHIIRDSFFEDLLNRIYVIIGVAMLFIVAYSLLKAIVNPDNLSKETGKLVTNIIISIVLLSITPTIFTYARKLQDIIINENILERIFLPSDKSVSIESTGTSTSLMILEAFLQMPDGVYGNSPSINAHIEDQDGSYVTWRQLTNAIRGGAISNFMKIGYWAEPVNQGMIEDSEGNEYKITYIPLVGTFCGLFLIYVLVSFCIDLGIRVVKLAFYQIIAPIPILMRVLPEKKSVFDNWVKASLATYLEVFIRMVIMFIVVVITHAIFYEDVVQLQNKPLNTNKIILTSNNVQLTENNDYIIDNNLEMPEKTNVVPLRNEYKLLEGQDLDQTNSSQLDIFGKVMVVLGLFAFAKQAPKLIGDVIGVDSGNIKLGIGGKLAASGALGLAAMFGGGLSTGIKNFNSRTASNISDIKSARGFLGKTGALLKTVGSVATINLASGIAGTVSGAARSAKSGFAAKNYSDVVKAATEGAQKAVDARDKRAVYRANHGGTVITTLGGHIVDASKSVATFAGIMPDLSSLKAVQEKANEVKNARKAIDDKLMSMLTKYKDEMETAGPAIDAGFTDASGHRVTFKNYATLLNEMEIMKSTGKLSDGITDATSDMLTKISAAEYKLKEQMKQEILEGYDLRNKAGHGRVQFSEADFAQFYDGELQSLVTDYRTKALQNASIIDKNVDKSVAAFATAMNTYTTQAVKNKSKSLYSFVTDSDRGAYNLFEKSKDAISSATGTIDNKVNKKYQEQAKKDGK